MKLLVLGETCGTGWFRLMNRSRNKIGSAPFRRVLLLELICYMLIQQYLAIKIGCLGQVVSGDRFSIILSCT